MEFYFAGGAMEVGGSCIYVRIAGQGILMDAGIRQSGGRDPLPDFRGIQMMGGVDAILVSHAHMDHTGSLPVISKAYPLAKIYMTKMTAELTRVLLYDSLKLMERQEDGIPQYNANDVIAMLNRIAVLPWQAEREILPGFFLTLYPAGHIAGASCLFLKTPEGSIFYSGDVSGFAQQTIEGISFPRLRPDITIVESTYGDRLHAVRRTEEERLASLVSECVQAGEKVLIPTFALGRSQEVILILRKAIQDGKIPKVPVYVDGMVRDINRVYTGNPTFLKNALARRILKGDEPFYTEEIKAVPPTADRDELLSAPGAAVFVTSSGMLTGGPSVQYARTLIPQEKACVILTGYQDEEAPGRTLMNLLEDKEEEKKITLDGLSLPVRCRTEMVGLSAHADRTEISGIVDKLASRHVILVHGSETAIGELGEELALDYRRRVYRPGVGESLELTVHKKREQLSMSQLFPHTLHRQDFEDESDTVFLWDYLRQHYMGRRFTAEQIAFVWYGRLLPEDEAAAFFARLLEGPYFSRDLHRLYLLEANDEEEVSKLLKGKPDDQHAIDERVKELLSGYEIRKISLYPEKKEALVSVNFPDALGKDFDAESEQLFAETGWRMSLRPVTNHQAAQALLAGLFSERGSRISYYELEKRYVMTLPSLDEGDEERAEKFRQQVGWSLILKDPEGRILYGQASPGAEDDKASLTDGKASEADASDDWFSPEPGMEPVNQAMAFYLIDMEFQDSEVQPYRKSIRSDYIGKYIDLAFISPAKGRLMAPKIEAAARRCGWRLHISESINQNELMKIAAQLAGEYGFPMKKQPSFLPASQVIRLKKDSLPDGSEEALAEMCREFAARTGIRMEIW